MADSLLMKVGIAGLLKMKDICTGNNRQVFMVRFVHSTHSQFHPSVAGKWLVWGTLMMLLAGVAIIVFRYSRMMHSMRAVIA